MDEGLAIDQFMWKWQVSFRISVENLVEAALGSIGARLDPEVLMIGFTDESGAPHPVCIEPEAGPLRPEHLAGLDDRAEAVYQAHPESTMWYSDPTVGEIRERYLRGITRGRAIADLIEESGALPGRHLEFGPGGRVGNFDVFVGVAVDRAGWEGLPHLEGEKRGGWTTPPGLVDRVIRLALGEATAALQAAEPNSGDLRRRSRDIVHEAADSFSQGCIWRAGSYDIGSVLENLNAIAQRPYEGTGASGRIVFVSPDHADVRIEGRLNELVSLDSSRAVRKLLETTSDDFSLLASTDGVYGFGRVQVAVPANDVFEIEITGHAQWELRGAGSSLMRVSYGDVTLPRPMFGRRGVEETLQRVFGDGADVEGLLGLIEAATKAEHGTTLVISGSAESESARLAGSATRLEPQPLTPALLDRYATMDGAVLVDPVGVCFAVGVILDGQAHAGGDPARGARYNSALRYEAGSEVGTVIAVVSEDGGVTVVPPPRRRVRRQAVEDAVLSLEQLAGADQWGPFGESYQAVKDLKFYLSADQRERTNAAIAAEIAQREASGAMYIVWQPIEPSLGMDDSYFLD